MTYSELKSKLAAYAAAEPGATGANGVRYSLFGAPATADVRFHRLHGVFAGAVAVEFVGEDWA